jgi:starvation-inducible outer membrane lipoprotein
MAGMLTGDRSVRIEVSGLCQQPTSKRSNYTVTVPYQSMSKTIQTISRMGGKVVGVQVGDTKASLGTATESKPEAAEKSKAPAKAETTTKSKSKKGR